MDLVKGRVGEIDVPGIHLLLAQTQTFTEPLEVDDLPLPEEADHVIYVRVVRQPQDVVIGDPGLLLGGQVLGQVGDGIAGGLYTGGRPGEAGGGCGVDAGGVVHEVGGKRGVIPYLLVGEVPGQLVDDSRHHLHVSQLLGAYRGVEMYHFKTGKTQ